MKKSLRFLIVSTLIISNCSMNIDNSKSPLPQQTENTTKLNTTGLKKVEIEILNPSNSEKTSVDWYRDNNNSLIMKVNAKAKVIGTVTLKDKTRSSNIKWSSSDNTLVFINNDGVIQANKIGNTSILASSVIDTDYKEILNIKIVDEANFAPEKITEVEKIETKISRND